MKASFPGVSDLFAQGKVNDNKGRNPLYDAVQNRRMSVRCQPTNTILYEVLTSDTLASIAARFNTTPSELAILNKLSCRTIFPSQIIFVPDVNLLSILGVSNSSAKSEDTHNGRPSPKPGRVQRVNAPDAGSSSLTAADECHLSPSQIAEDLNKESLTKFLKIQAKHITDGEGVVDGVLLVTPNHFMFDPNVMDPLVLEHGIEKYGVVAPIHMVVRTALYTDIVRMRVKGSAQLRSEDTSLKIYHSKKLAMKKSFSEDEPLNFKFSFDESDLNSAEKASEDGLLGKRLSKISEVSNNEDKLDSKSETSINSESEMPLNSKSENLLNSKPENLLISKSEMPLNSKSESSIDSVKMPNREISVTSINLEEEEDDNDEEADIVTQGKPTKSKEKSPSKKISFERTKNKLHKGLLKFSRADTFFPTVSGSRRMSMPTSTSFQELKSKVFDTVNIKKTNKEKEEPKAAEPVASFTNMVEQKPDLFTSIDKLIPRPAKSFDDNPLYLCLCMGRPMNHLTKVKSSPVISFGRKLKEEYWFSIPRSRVDSLYWFLLRWVPERYGEVSDINLEELGFFPITDTDIPEEDEEDSIPPPAARTRSASWAFPWSRKKSTEKEVDLNNINWEFVHQEDAPNLEPECSATTSEASLPELLNPSDILTEEHILRLNPCLPPRAVGYSWNLAYSTAHHGFSLKTLYREMSKLDCPILIVVADTTGCIFGAVLSSPLKPSDHFYGTGESFLYTFEPEFKCYTWTGDNCYFIKGNTASFAVGASDGYFGLWLDDDLFHGCTKSCRTFANEPLCPQEDFIVKSLEVWGFV